MLLSSTVYAFFVVVMESDNHMKQFGLDDDTPMVSQRDVELPVISRGDERCEICLSTTACGVQAC